MPTALSEKKCAPCKGGTPPLGSEEAVLFLREVPGWELSEDRKSVSRMFKFKNFVESMAFVNRVADLAEAEGHHPDIHVSWNKVRFELSTHAIGGLSENDFILAAKINNLTSNF